MSPKILLILPVFLFFYSCGGETSNHTEELTINSKYIAGEKVYMSSCVACHQTNGEGVEGAFPPLANSDYLFADKTRAIDIAANGMNGEIEVNGMVYNMLMANQGLTRKEVKDVVNYILNAWGNDGGEVTMEEVANVMK